MSIQLLPSTDEGKKTVVSPTQTPLSTLSISSHSTIAPLSQSSCSVDSSLGATRTAAGISATTMGIPAKEPEAAANIATVEGKDSRPSTGDSTSTISDDGFSIITAAHYSGMRPLIEVVSDSFKPTLDGHTFSPEASEFIPREDENGRLHDDYEGHNLSVVDIRDPTLSVGISGASAGLNTTSSTRTTADPNPLDGPYDSQSSETGLVEGSFGDINGPEYWDNFRGSVQRVSPQYTSLEERFEAKGAYKCLIAPIAAIQAESDDEKDYDGSNRRNDSLSYEELETDESSELSVSNIDETENAATYFSGEEQPTPRPLPPHLRVGAEDRPLHEAVSHRNHAASSESDTREVSVQDLIDSIRIENIALLATEMYRELAGISDEHFCCSVGPNPRVGSKNLFYTISLTPLKCLKEVTPAEWLMRIPIQARAFTLADSLWMDSDVKTMSFIYSQRDIPVPNVYSYSCYGDNKLGVPYVLMDCMKGSKVDDLWGAWGDNERIRCLSQCFKHLSSLRLYPFQKIGVLGMDYNEKRLCVQGPVIQLANGELRINGPYSSSKDYLLDIWNTKIMELKDNTDTESMRSRNHLVLLKLLTETLIERRTERFYLSLPELGGGNVLVDLSGNVTAFVGWEKVMILPKDLGYARYPEWITQDWVPLTKSKPLSKTTSNKASRSPGAQLFSVVDRSSVAGNSSDNEKSSEGLSAAGDTIDAHKRPANYDEFRNSLCPEYPTFQPHSQEFSFKDQDAQDPINHAASSSVTTAHGTVPKRTEFEYGDKPHEYEQYKYRREGNGGNRSYGGTRRRDGLGNTTRQNREPKAYDADAEMSKATTSQDKDRVHKISKWNSLSVKLRRDEITQKEDRRKAWESKPEAEKAAAIEQAYTLPPVVETFKKVSVGPDQTRRLVKVVRTDRDHSAAVADEMARYRAIYDDIVFKQSIEDSLATKESLVSSALYTALKDDDLRPQLIPRLAKQVFGEDIKPDILTMVGNSPWAKRLLSKLNDQRNANSKKTQPETKVTKLHGLYEHYIYIVEIIFLLGVLGISWYYLDITLYQTTKMPQVVSKIVTSVFLAIAVFLFLRVLFGRKE